MNIKFFNFIFINNKYTIKIKNKFIFKLFKHIYIILIKLKFINFNKIMFKYKEENKNTI